MPAQRQPTAWSFRRSLAFAFGLHALMIVLLLLTPTARRLVPEQMDSVSVEVVVQSTQPAVARSSPVVESPPQDKLIYPAVLAIPAPQKSADVLPSPPRDQVPVTTELRTVTRLFSASVLAEPRNAQARQGLGQLAGDEKAVQICNLEAMEQAARQQESLHPDFVVAYATADILMQEDLVIAEGAALRSRPDWLTLRYRCRVQPDRTGVIAFSFALDGAIPRSRWQEISLPSGSD
ncbi:DUF930 domain-containing protein [Hoeflea sp. AS60]|uniref:DUF930 domain-containing protein n=1 Tax=Hoeflea sp. AS60 TaxID=3135780 RepID=UPI00316CC3ED